MKDIMEAALAELLNERQLAQYGRLLVMTALKINAEANEVMQRIVAGGIESKEAAPGRPQLSAPIKRAVKLVEPATPKRKPSAQRSGPGPVESVDGWLTKLGAVKAHNIAAYTLTRIQKNCQTKKAQVIGPDGRKYQVVVIEPNSLDKAIKRYYKQPSPKLGRPVRKPAPHVIPDEQKYVGAQAGAALGLSPGGFYHHAKRLGVGTMSSRPGSPPAKLYSTADIMLVSNDMGIEINAAKLNGAVSA